ncbi:MAG: type II toxin-antitoxin system HicA family toxin [Planctomycetes bacterium]|nr:type II toxin-antitoxin system HicA family toxin [Planctomycetota bacterium]
MKFRDVVKLIEAEGWRFLRQKGSHAHYVHPVRPGVVTLAGKPSDDVPKGTLNSILKQAGLKGRMS